MSDSLNNPPALLVREVMSGDPAFVSPDEPLQAVLRLMAERSIGSVLVGSPGFIKGIFTERDLLRIAPDAPPGWRQQPVSAWMTLDPQTVSPDMDWEHAIALMDRFHIRHLPVQENGRIVGMVSSRQLITTRTEHLDRLVEERTRELKRITADVQQRERLTQRSMRVAGGLMNRLLLPSEPPRWPELSWAVQFRPLDPLGGDYYDFAQPDGRHLGILIADASGHSLPAAMVAIMARIAFAEASRSIVSPGAVLREMNQRLTELTEEQFVSAFYGVYDRVLRRFTFAGAGHPHPLHFIAKSDAVQALETRGLLLGIVHDAQYEEKAIELATGDRLCFFTDGVTESRDAAGNPYGTDRLGAALHVAQGHANAVLRSIADSLLRFRGAQSPSDDETLLVAEVKE